MRNSPGDTTRCFFFFINGFRARGELNSRHSCHMSKKRRREKMEARPTTTAERVKSDNGLLWRLVTDHPDIFDTHVVTKLNGNDVKFFYDVNSESRRAIQKSSNARLPDAFKIGDFQTKSTLSWALEKCSENAERFCWRMARNGNVELLQCFCTKTGALGMIGLVGVLHKMVTSSV